MDLNYVRRLGEKYEKLKEKKQYFIFPTTGGCNFFNCSPKHFCLLFILKFYWNSINIQKFKN